MSSLVQLVKFRQRNGLSQVELARLLGVSAAYLSSVESKGGKLSREKMKKLWELAEEKGWFPDDLVPAYERLNEVWFDVVSFPIVRTAPFCSSPPQDNSRQDDIRKFEEDFTKVISESLRESIRLGQQGIDSVLAERIIAILPKWYSVYKEWLISGEGPKDEGEAYMDAMLDEQSVNSMRAENKDRTLILLERMLKQQEELATMMSEIRTLLMNKA